MTSKISAQQHQTSPPASNKNPQKLQRNRILAPEPPLNLRSRSRTQLHALRPTTSRAAARTLLAMLPKGHGSADGPISTPTVPECPTPDTLEVLVYCGEGAGHQSARHTLRALQTCLAPGVEARLMDTEELLEGSWRGRCLMLAMPGGADLPYCKHLNGPGNSLIRAFVDAGGSYLGICAGAYYGCGRVEFEQGGPLEVVGDRELGFFPGTARGAAYPGFDYSSELGAHAVPLLFRPLSSPPPRTSSTSFPSGAKPWTSEVVVIPQSDWDDVVGSAPASHPTDGLYGGRRDVDFMSTQQLRLEAHHLVLDGYPRAEGYGGGDCHSNGGGTCAMAAQRWCAARDAAAAASSSGGGEYDNWMYCRDYSNGGPVFLTSKSSWLYGSTSESAPLAADASAAASATSSAAYNNGHSQASADSLPYNESREGYVPAHVEVLAVYPELGNAVGAIRCFVGKGIAVLCGTHPEMPQEALACAVQSYDGQLAEHVARLAADLANWEKQRRQLWATLLLACCTATSSASPTPMRTVMGLHTVFESREEVAGRGGTN